MKKHSLGITGIALVCLLSVAAHGELIGYWDFNNSTMDRSMGTNGTMSANPAGFLATLNYKTGTSSNAWSGTPAGMAMQFHDAVAVLPDGNVEIESINMTGAHSLNVSFAIRSEHTFVWHEHVRVSYNLDGGGWVLVVNLPEPSVSWGVHSVDIPNSVDNQSIVGVRIEVRSWANINEAVEFDNITLQAIPEPGTAVLLFIGMSGLVFVRSKS